MFQWNFSAAPEVDCPIHAVTKLHMHGPFAGFERDMCYGC